MRLPLRQKVIASCPSCKLEVSGSTWFSTEAYGNMGYAVSRIGFDGAVPSFETLRDTLAERLGTPIDLVETPPGFWVGMARRNGGLRGFSVLRRGNALEPEWECNTPDDELLLRILTELGGTLEVVNSPAPLEVRNRLTYTGAVPTPEQVEARLAQETGILPTSERERAYEFPACHELYAWMLEPRLVSVTLSLEPYGVHLSSMGGLPSIIWEAADALVALGGRRLDDDDLKDFET
jgi:hypothetical protein